MTSTQEFSVLTYNIRHGRGLDDWQNLKRTLHVLEKAEVDLIGLQEVDKNNPERSQNVDQTRVLSNGLGMGSHFVPAITEPFYYGNAVLASLPIVKQNGFVMPKLGTFEERSVAAMEVLIDNTPITFLSTHLGLKEGERLKHIGLILDYVKKLNQPVILVGDWNEEPGGAAYNLITEVLIDTAAHIENAEPTFPQGGNVANLRIDYIFVSPEIEILSVDVIQNWASDHLPIKALLKLK